MKILKPGKVEQRKSVCCCCGCEYVAAPSDLVFDDEIQDEVMPCPQIGCGSYQVWEYGEPYEEPTTTQDDVEKLVEILQQHFALYDERANSIACTLAAYGVTFREG